MGVSWSIKPILSASRTNLWNWDACRRYSDRRKHLMPTACKLQAPMSSDISEAELGAEIARIPLDHYVVWNGRPRVGRPGSVPTLAFSCIDAPWSPMSLRELVARTARMTGGSGFRIEAVRKAIWAHQCAKPASYFLVQAKLSGEYLAVTDVPRPSSWPAPIKPGEVVISRQKRLDISVERGGAPLEASSRAPCVVPDAGASPEGRRSRR